MLFGSERDFNLLTKVNRELLSDIVEQEILYYKFSLDETTANLYGEALEKVFQIPVKLSCLITRGDQVVTTDDMGPDLNREASVVVPEVGDIINWQENFYEVDTVRENQLFVGRDNSYNLTDYGNKFGKSVSIIVDCHLTRADRVGITE